MTQIMYDASRMYQIDDRLFQGGSFDEPKALDESWVLANLSHVYPNIEHRSRCVVLHMPIDDGPAIPVRQLKRMIKCVELFHEDPLHNIYICCAAGISRSSFLTAAFLMKQKDWSIDKALNHIASINPFIGPAQGFMNTLKQWKRLLSGDQEALNE